MGQAGAALSALDGEDSNLRLMLALETAIVVSYSRAFTQSSLLMLNEEEYRPEDARQSELHSLLLDLRDKAYAHTDKEGGRFAAFVELMDEVELESLEEIQSVDDLPPHFTGLVRTEWIALPREWFPGLRLLFEGQARRFFREAMVIEVRLRRQSGSPGAHTGGPP
jgi:hypothetical protein